VLLRLAALVFAALATGGLVVNGIGLARAMARLSCGRTYTAIHQATNRTFDPYMPIVVWSAVAGGVGLVLISPGMQTASGAFALAGVVCYAAVLAISLPTCVRINGTVACWSPDAPPRDWRSVRSRWIRFHALRTLISAPALVAYLLAVLTA
jgi:uncharacterized membrane protein